MLQIALSFGLGLYIFVYAFEAPVRWLLDMAGASELIFARDVLLGVPIAIIFAQQILRRNLHPAYLVYLFVVLVHGTVMLLNFGSWFTVLYSAKMLLSMLAGAVVPPKTFRPSKNALRFFFVIWAVSAFGIILDKYFVEFPWMGGMTTIGGQEVEISRDWQISGDNKRAGGFTRMSINAAFLEPLISFTLLYNLRKTWLKGMVIVVTIFVVYCTTQKGALFAYLLAACLPLIMPRKPLRIMQVACISFLILCIALPIFTPLYIMPPAAGVFSMSSFYDRVEWMWPDAWVWIDNHQLFPLGVGLGGISGAQRFYAPNEINFADNLFVFMYAFFGMMTFVYLGWIAWKVISLRKNTSSMGIQAVVVLTFIFIDGCVLSLLEDQMAGLFFGAALAALGGESLAQRREQQLQRETLTKAAPSSAIPALTS